MVNIVNIKISNFLLANDQHELKRLIYSHIYVITMAPLP